jgi:hypothetical protein
MLVVTQEAHAHRLSGQQAHLLLSARAHLLCNAPAKLAAGRVAHVKMPPPLWLH